MAITKKHGHSLSDPIPSPAYVDANFLIYHFVGSQRVPNAQAAARNVMGDLLSQQVEILISLVTLEETMWGTLQELYCKHIWQPSHPSAVCAKPTSKILEQNLSSLRQFKSDIESIVENLVKLRLSGTKIRFVPDADDTHCACLLAPDLMFRYNLLSADALHLSCALNEAKTLITFDSDFERVTNTLPYGDLTIILLSP